MEDFEKVEKFLDVQIKIIDSENFNQVIYAGVEQPIKLCLYKDKNHYDVINSLTGFYNRSYYCHRCDIGYNTKNRHKCKTPIICPLCKLPSHDLTSRDKKYCNECNRFCYNDTCLANHHTVCSTVYKCTGCKKIISREKYHKCGFSICHNCLKDVETASHKCFIQKKESKGGLCKIICECNTNNAPLNKGCLYKESSKEPIICKEPCICNDRSDKKISRCTYNEKYIFFDYEAMQNTGIHIPNLVIAQDFHGNKFTFKDNTAFVTWLISHEHQGYTAIAHNSKSYDSYFILKYCVENGIKPFTIYNGSKLMLLEVPSIKLKIIDSSNFVSGPLSDFPTTFGLNENKKGFFPHYFNIPSNQKYVGPIPDVKYYGDYTMKPKQREIFLKWHSERVSENYIFDFEAELESYCASDVDILRRGCLAFRKEFLEIANIDPLQYLTIASVCMAIYRSKYMPTDTIAIDENDKKDTYSKASIAWLRQFSNVRHALNGGEVTICGAKVDGFDENTNTVYQYHGCFFHGCKKCYNPDTINKLNNETMDDLYEKTVLRSNEIKAGGYNLVEIWECEWVKSKTYKNVKPFGFIEPLIPRDGFYGGRTNATKLKVSGKKLNYIDLVSLYPSVMYLNQFPINHPIKIYNPVDYDPQWFGLIKATILPPSNLYHPVIPYRSEKLMFVLCRTCMTNETHTCNHTDDERCFTGTWATPEVNKSLEKGYKIMKIHEVWNFPQKSNNLFKGYVDDFMKIKMESSPHNYSSTGDYVLAIKKEMGLDLNPAKVKYNPGRRAVAKIALNSLYGKFAQRNSLSETLYITDLKSWYNILLNEEIEISNCIFLTDNMVQVTYKYKDIFVKNNWSTNIFIACFTTTHARLRLYEMLEKLDENVVYYDTDSIVYIDDGTNTVETGEMLGDWSNELGDNEYIIEWVSTGPKSYFFKTNKDREVTKIKGFTLSYENKEKLNSESLKAIILDKTDSVTLKFDQICRDTKTKNIVTKKRTTKTFKMDYKKRRIVENDNDDFIDTLPWGACFKEK